MFQLCSVFSVKSDQRISHVVEQKLRFVSCHDRGEHNVLQALEQDRVIAIVQPAHRVSALIEPELPQRILDKVIHGCEHSREDIRIQARPFLTHKRSNQQAGVRDEVHSFDSGRLLNKEILEASGSERLYERHVRREGFVETGRREDVHTHGPSNSLQFVQKTRFPDSSFTRNKDRASIEIFQEGRQLCFPPN